MGKSFISICLLLGLLLTNPLNSFSQVITQNEVDAFTGRTIITVDVTDRGLTRERSSNYIDDSRTGRILPRVRYVKFEDDEEAVLLTLNVRRLPGCLSQHSSSIIILLEGGETVQLGQITSTECRESAKSASFVLGMDNPSLLDDRRERFDERIILDGGFYLSNYLSDKAITAIRVIGSEGYLNYDISENNQMIIAEMIQLLLDEIESI